MNRSRIDASRRSRRIGEETLVGDIASKRDWISMKSARGFPDRGKRKPAERSPRICGARRK